MTIYYPTLALISAAGFDSFRQLYKYISSQGCQDQEFFSVTYIDDRGELHTIEMPVWKIIVNSLWEVTKRRRK